VLFGVKKWNDPTVLNSLLVGDERSAYPLKVDTPSGPVWHRFTFDGYGEQANGDDWDLFFGNFQRQTRGRLWPLLTGERGEYELIAGRSAGTYLDTIANTANDGLMLPEQVWTTSPRPASSPARARAPRRRWPGRTASSCGSPGRSTPASRSSARGSWPAATSGSCARELTGAPTGGASVE
jgi:hypothetical protein